MGLWARTAARMRLVCNCELVIGQDTSRISHTPQFLYFKNRQSSLDNHQSVAEKTAGTVSHLAITNPDR